VKTKWCNLCKELSTEGEFRQHGYLEFGNLDHAGKIFFRKLQCGCQMEKCLAGKKSFVQCGEHRQEMQQLKHGK